MEDTGCMVSVKYEISFDGEISFVLRAKCMLSTKLILSSPEVERHLAKQVKSAIDS